jgi:hypothetical protein
MDSAAPDEERLDDVPELESSSASIAHQDDAGDDHADDDLGKPATGEADDGKPEASGEKVRGCSWSRLRLFARRFIQYSLLLFVVFILVLWMGAEIEGNRVGRLPDTAHFYDGEAVCGLTYNLTVPENHTTGPRQTYGLFDIATYTDPVSVRSFRNETAEPPLSIQPAAAIVAHCGDCGSCSNPHDIGIYDETKDTLFATTVDCSKRGLLWGRKTASTCMNEQVGFTYV